jgi:peptide/nickel transport system permease protein
MRGARRIAREAGDLFVTLLAVSMLSFLLVALMPGDLALLILGDAATPERLVTLRAEMGLDQPLPLRYLRWLGQVLQGDLGRSVHSGETTLAVLLARLPVTLELMIATQVVALVLAVPLGVWSAHRRGSTFDRATLFGSLVLLSTPVFVLALALVSLFALKLGWLPATGHVALTENPVGNLRSLVLPVLALSLIEVPVYLRLLRSEMVATLQQNFILLARGLGLPPWRILLENALRPASLGMITTVGINMGRLMGGAVVIETIFALPGVGQMLLESIYQQDIVVTQGIVLFIGVAFTLLNRATDWLCALVDPRLAGDDRVGRDGAA